MLRWKLLIPLAILLTGIGLLGNHFWFASASSRSLSSLNDLENVSVALEDTHMLISVNNGQALADILDNIDHSQIKELLSDRELKLQRSESLPVETGLVQQVDLILAQAASTHEFYTASLSLQELARQQGYNAVMIIWEDRIVAEVAKGELSYIAQQPVKGVRE